MVRLSAVLLMLGLGCLEFGYIVAECAGPTMGIDSFLQLEAVLVKHLESYVDKVQNEQETISSYLTDIDNLHEHMNSPEEYYGNPINAFLTINRFASLWKHEIFDVLLENNTHSEYISAIDTEMDKKKLRGPTNEDLLIAAGNLLDMQELTRIPTSELANEVVLRDFYTDKNVTLSASECYEIGSSFYELQSYEYAAQWLQQARKRASLETSASASKIHILQHLALVYKKLNNTKLAYKLTNEILKLEPTNQEALNTKTLLETELLLDRIRISKVTVDEETDENHLEL
ncbi:PREDICTED: prolyl 4-hydroxylase subunit alpha-1-like [Drosophila arizonae]|uniref:Prolyl 4-hydroxylase subunit alpha-1-like n=1 Tax=Drosophila arizonae TaxID=7263 RepID=A0ABM1PXN6_DROAR|nr:PREDICTED: prolyl 4-hydroxylase subunit alpha-1-like [Drosophila arizonae]